jgi:hypothetical protein
MPNQENQDLSSPSEPPATEGRPRRATGFVVFFVLVFLVGVECVFLLAGVSDQPWATAAVTAVVAFTGLAVIQFWVEKRDQPDINTGLPLAYLIIFALLAAGVVWNISRTIDVTNRAPQWNTTWRNQDSHDLSINRTAAEKRKYLELTIKADEGSNGGSPCARRSRLEFDGEGLSPDGQTIAMGYPPVHIKVRLGSGGGKIRMTIKLHTGDLCSFRFSIIKAELVGMTSPF